MPTPESILSRLEMFGVRLGLERARALLARLGDPQNGMAVVLVAGSNGKGSTAALLSSIVGAAGYRVGLYTSPHLETVEERVRVGGLAIDSATLGDLLAEVIAAAEAGREELPTYFEALTIAALLAFERAGVDLAVLEVGLGGRLDATNVCQPTVSLITSISLDHQKVLGETLREIALEKAGILRRGVAAGIWVEEREARNSLLGRASELGVPVVDARAELRWPAIGESDLVVATRNSRYRLRLPLEGAFQRRNAGLAVVGSELLRDAGWSKIDRRAVEDGIGRCRWPGRLEMVDIGAGRAFLLDAAHNLESIDLLRQHVEERYAGSGGFDLIFGALDDKAAEIMLRTIAGRARNVWVAAPRSDRAIPARVLAKARPGAIAVEDHLEALECAVEAGSATTLVCGSIYLVGEIRAELRRLYGVPAPAASVIVG